MRRLGLSVGLAVVILAGAGAAGAFAYGLPASPVSLNGRLQVAPAEITVSEDGNAFIVGPWKGSYRGWAGAPKHFPAIHWTDWSTSHAVGTGTEVVGNCKPNCTHGTFTAYALRLWEWRPRVVHGRLIFTRLRWQFIGRRPPLIPPSVTATAHYLGRGIWGWNPS